MAKAAVQGLAPYVPSARPRAPARWWAAAGDLGQGRLRVETLEEGGEPPAVTAPCGIAAPCSLPRPFLEFLGVARSVDVDGTADRLFRRARAFAAAATRGRRHPLRVPHESLPALDRRRLPLFLAALPLLRAPAGALLVEVDPPAMLRSLELPHARLRGTLPAAVDARAGIVDALVQGALGFRLYTPHRDRAVASLPALFALLACAMAGWTRVHGVGRPADAEAWIPLPQAPTRVRVRRAAR
jgi:hypothetical protein